MKKLLLLPLLSFVALCGCTGQKSKEEVPDLTETIDTMVVAPRDSDLYEMGRRHAAFIINNYSNADSIGDRLLEIRARESEIRRRIDDAAARTYVYGFERYVKENSPSLASEIL